VHTTPASSLTGPLRDGQCPAFRASCIWPTFAAESDRDTVTYLRQLSCSTVDTCYSYQVKWVTSMAVLTSQLGD